MLGRKSRDFKQQMAISLETLVPPSNFYRQVDQCIDLSFVRDLAAGQNLKRLIKQKLGILFCLFPRPAFPRLNFDPTRTFSTACFLVRLNLDSLTFPRF